MFIPYHVDVPFNHRPVMNWIVVFFVIVIFLQTMPISDPFIPQRNNNFVLDGWSIKGLFGHMWLHGNLFHLIGNLIFLWLFGNAVCSKIGNIFYLPVYISLGLIAGVCHLIFDGDPAVGASGAINGIVGMYLVFFPENDISCMFWFFLRPYFFSISGIWIILLWFLFDVIGAFSGSSGVAYFAHIGGFVGGFSLAILMLITKWIVMEKDEGSILDFLGFNKKVEAKTHRTDINYVKQNFKIPKREKMETNKLFVDHNEVEVNNKLIRFSCQCGQKIKIDKIHAGKIGRCPKCKNKLKIPG